MSLPQWIEESRQTVAVPPPPPPPHDPHVEIAMAGEPPRKLEFVMEPQKRRFWCWAAVSTSVARFYEDEKKWTQCLIASIARKQEDCCSDTVSEDCDERHSLKDALCIVEHLRDDQSGTVPLTDENGGPSLKSELDAGCPVGSYIETKVGHFVVLYGYNLSDGQQMIDVADPSPDRETHSTYDFGLFVKGYHGSKWSHTYFTR